MKHTPGHWTVDEEHSGIFEKGNQFTSEGIKQSHCWIEEAWNGKNSDEESRANDFLIAAAPEMLSYLIDLCNRFCIKENLKTHGKDRILFGEYGRLIEIIEKATGMEIEEVLK